MTRIMVVLALSFLPVIGVAQTVDEIAFPTPIDISTQRKLLSETFPKIDNSLKTIDGLKKYRRDLENYRLTQLEEFNDRILKICKELKSTERVVNKSFQSGDMSPNEKKSLDSKIAAERAKCIVPKLADSDYWKLYDNWLDFYREQSKESQKDLASCNASSPCRLRQV
ncbi:MAG: hypothetical protein AAFQ19_07795 [Pseudomonadota bacterium]